MRSPTACTATSPAPASRRMSRSADGRSSRCTRRASWASPGSSATAPAAPTASLGTPGASTATGPGVPGRCGSRRPGTPGGRVPGKPSVSRPPRHWDRSMSAWGLPRLTANGDAAPPAGHGGEAASASTGPGQAGAARFASAVSRGAGLLPPAQLRPVGLGAGGDDRVDGGRGAERDWTAPARLEADLDRLRRKGPTEPHHPVELASTDRRAHRDALCPGDASRSCRGWPASFSDVGLQVGNVASRPLVVTA